MTRGVASFVGIFVALGCASVASAAENSLERGKYLAEIMDCTGCHTPGAMTGHPDQARFLAGADVGFEIPNLGIFYPPNLTSDSETGLGKWSEEEIVAAVTKGVTPDGRQLIPTMPWASYAALTAEDARSLAAYLKSLPPIVSQVPGPLSPGEDSPLPYLRMKLPN